jgi:hypothetical protein
MKYYRQFGGGQCSICGASNTNKQSCPLNPENVGRDKAKLHALGPKKQSPKKSSKKTSPRKSKSPSPRKKTPSPKKKTPSPKKSPRRSFKASPEKSPVKSLRASPVRSEKKTPPKSAGTSPKKKSPEKKSPEKKSPEKKSPEKKSPEKKSPEKKSPEKKSPEKKSPKKSKKAQRKAPAESATKFAPGTIKTGQDGRKYIIKVRVNGTQYWQHCADCPSPKKSSPKKKSPSPKKKSPPKKSPPTKRSFPRADASFAFYKNEPANVNFKNIIADDVKEGRGLDGLLFYAITQPHNFLAVKYLLEKGANPNAKMGTITVFDLALHNRDRSAPVILLLLEAGARPDYSRSGTGYSRQRTGYSRSGTSKRDEHYATLEIPINSSKDEIRKAYKKLALKWHPDKNKGKEKIAEKKFREVKDAYDALMR